MYFNPTYILPSDLPVNDPSRILPLTAQPGKIDEAKKENEDEDKESQGSDNEDNADEEMIILNYVEMDGIPLQLMKKSAFGRWEVGQEDPPGISRFFHRVNSTKSMVSMTGSPWKHLKDESDKEDCETDESEYEFDEEGYLKEDMAKIDVDIGTTPHEGQFAALDGTIHSIPSPTASLFLPVSPCDSLSISSKFSSLDTASLYSAMDSDSS